MNCKPGDIARIVASAFQQNLNAIVSVIEAGPMALDGLASWRCLAMQRITAYEQTPSGRVVGILALNAGSTVLVFDRDLRPLYDGDGVDEVLIYAGLPKEKVDAG